MPITQEEANKIAAVIRTADGGCSVCVRSLCASMTKASLGFRFEMTGNKVEQREQPAWSDDPDDADVYNWPEVLATPTNDLRG